MNTDGWKMGCIGSRKLKYSQECDTLSIEQPCYRVADLYSYIEWGWCWWTRNRLTLKTWCLLECSFCHCWHSFIWFVTDDIRHRKTTPELWRVKRWRILCCCLLHEINHFVGGCSFSIHNIAYCFRWFKFLILKWY